MKPNWSGIGSYLKAQHAALFAIVLIGAIHLRGCLPGPTPTPAPVEVLPATATGSVGKVLELDAQTPAAVTWQVFGIDPAQTRAHGNKLVLVPEKDGKIVVLALVAKSSKVITYECDVTVGDAPPGPGPTPPTPTDPLAAAVQAAYASETDPAKAESAALLAQLYGYAAGSAGVGNVTTVSTWQDLELAMAAKSTSLGAKGKLVAVQTAIGQAFVAAVPGAATMTATISPADRTAAAAFFSKAAGIVGVLK